MDPDLELLERVLMRLAIAENDQLEKQLNSLLVPVLSKLLSGNEQVRAKVLEILGHINKRVKPLPQVQLPLKGLLEQYTSPDSTAFLLNFSVIYLDMAFGRASVEDRVDAVPSLLNGISSKPSNQQDTIMHMVTSVIEKIPVPNKDEDKELKFPFAKNPADSIVILDFWLVLLLATPQDPKEPEYVPPGMSIKSYKRILQRLPNADLLRARKLGVLEFLAKGRVFSDAQILPHLIVASCDNHHLVQRQGEDGIKRVRLLLEDKQVIQTLFLLFQGNSADTTIAKEDKKQPVNPQFKIKLLLNYFTRSVIAANYFPNSLQVIFDCVYGQDSTLKSKQAAMSFVHWVFRQASDDQLKMMAPIILSGLLKLLNQLREQKDTSTGIDSL